MRFIGLLLQRQSPLGVFGDVFIPLLGIASQGEDIDLDLGLGAGGTDQDHGAIGQGVAQYILPFSSEAVTFPLAKSVTVPSL